MTGATRGAGTATLPEHACSSPLFFRGDRVTRSLVLCVIIVVRCLFALLTIVLYVFLLFMNSDDPFGILNRF